MITPEFCVRNAEVRGSIPLISTIIFNNLATSSWAMSAGLAEMLAEVAGRSRERIARVPTPESLLFGLGWVGPTEKLLGANTDKGHFMAHSIGGGLEINVFAQQRATNRGWSETGRIFRQMEKYCFDNPGTYCFSRPLYSDLTSRPRSFDFGVLKSATELWVERFVNI